MPKFVIDEDMPRSTAEFLRKHSYEALDIRDYGLRGSNDDVIYQFAQENESTLITGDTHYDIIRVQFCLRMSIVIYIIIYITKQFCDKIYCISHEITPYVNVISYQHKFT